jgi:7-carboxy-7-deazaguanine synthase
MTGDLLVAEIFGPTLQGEGPSVGQRAAFLRLSRCNLSCTWCDTPYTWDSRRFDLAAETHRMSQCEVGDRLLDIDAPLVVITGGEPLLQQERLTWLVDLCRARGKRVEIETNGTIAPSQGLAGALRGSFNVSPKLAGSGQPHDLRIKDEVLNRFVRTGKALFKFVVTDPSDLEEIAELEAEFGLAPVWVMPEGTDDQTTLTGMRLVADEALARGWNLTPRLHILLWGDTRGR